MKSLENLLEDFISKNEWNINKLKGTDVIYYLQENIKHGSMFCKEDLIMESYINEYGDLVLPEDSKLFNEMLCESDVARLLLKDML
jgi:hypothetical protein